jgi:hypothetical protein
MTGARAPLCVLLIALTACASEPPAPVEYLLRPPLEQTAQAAEPTPYAALGNIALPVYLERQGIVVETGGHRIQVARDHRWAEPLSRAIRRMLQVGIAEAAGRGVAASRAQAKDPEVVIDVTVHQLHGSVDGEVVLAADWQVEAAADGRILRRGELAERTLTDAAGYDALVDAHAELLDRLSSAIADSLP